MKKLLNKEDFSGRWTRQATFCYCIGAQCSICNIPEDFKIKCQMKNIILDLVQYKDKPPKKFIESLKEGLDSIGIDPDKFLIGE